MTADSLPSLADLGNVGTIATAVIALLAMVFACWQIIETRRQRLAQLVAHVYEFLGSKESRANRRFIFNELPAGADPASLTVEQWERIEAVWSEFEHAAQYVELGLVPIDVLTRRYSIALITTWERLEPFILYQGERRGASGIFLEGFETLARHARESWSKNFPGRKLPGPVVMFPTQVLMAPAAGPQPSAGA